jgi:putative zinc finger/helix-turn-helix YgiT family protein
MTKRDETKRMNAEARYTEFNVHIPNLEGDAVGEVVPIQIPVTTDPTTGEELLTPEAIELIETTKARYMGLLLPNDIREMRERLGLTQKEMSELLQAGEKSYTRWESGRARPSRMVNVLLRLLFEGKISLDTLAELDRPRQAELTASVLQETPPAYKTKGVKEPRANRKVQKRTLPKNSSRSSVKSTDKSRK